jgi:hypothetical protein
MSIADAHFMSEMAEDENALQDEHPASLLTFQDGLYPGSLSTPTPQGACRHSGIFRPAQPRSK